LKKFMLYLLIVVFIGIGTPVLAFEDYSGFKGDFSIFSLGDDVDTIKDKIDFLVDKKIAIKEDDYPVISYGFASVLMKISKEEFICTLNFGNEGVYCILICYMEYRYTGQQFNTIIPKIINQKKDEFSKEYGEPIVKRAIPVYKDFLTELDSYNIWDVYGVYEWLNADNRILLGIHQEGNPGLVILKSEEYLDILRFRQIDSRSRYKMIFIPDDSDITYFFDSNSIKSIYNNKVKDNVIDVWLYKYYTTKGKNKFITDKIKFDSSANYDQFDHCLEHWLISANNMCILSIYYYASDGDIINRETFTDDFWDEIIPETVGEAIANAVKDYMKPKLQPKPKTGPEKEKISKQ
jgi:hypothetical protein